MAENNNLELNPFDWVLCDDDNWYPVLVEWGNGSKGFLIADHKGRRKDAWKYLDGYPAFICDIGDFIMIGDVGGMYNRTSIYIIDVIDYDLNLVITCPWFIKINDRIECGKPSKFTDGVEEILRSRAASTNRRDLFYGLEPR